MPHQPKREPTERGMIGRRSLLGLSAASAAGLTVCGCDFLPYYWFTVRYRLTLEVETPDGLKVGSGVIENVWTRNEFDIPRSSVRSRDRGEAVVVDLGSHGLLFALLCGRDRNGSRGSSDNMHDLPLEVFQRIKAIGPNTGTPGAQMRQLIGLKQEAELTQQEIPFLVRFRDIADPATVEKVDPNNLAKSFGAGVRLKRATIEITSDPVTKGIEKRLGWLPQYYDKLFDGQRYQTIDATNRLANSLGSGDFKAGRN